MNASEAFKIVALLGSAFPAQPWPTPAIRLWARAIAEKVDDPADARAGIGSLLTGFSEARPVRCSDLLLAVRAVQGQRRAEERRQLEEARIDEQMRSLPARTARDPAHPRAALAVVAEVARARREGVRDDAELSRVAREAFEAELRERTEVERRIAAGRWRDG